MPRHRLVARTRRLALRVTLWAGLLPSSAFAQDALTLLHQGRIADALVAAEREAGLRPNDLDAQERWIDLLLGLGLQGIAQRACAERIAAHPDAADSFYLAGRASPDVGSSREHYERALFLDPNHARSWMGLGALDRAVGAWGDAAGAYQHALQLDPDLGEAWGGLLAVFSGTGDAEGGLKVARAALVRVPDLAEAWLAIATWTPQDSLKILDQAVTHVPWDGRVQTARAIALIRANRASEAAAAADKALAVDPANRDARLLKMAARAIVAGSLNAKGFDAIAAARNVAPGPAAVAAWDAIVSAWPRCPLGYEGRAHARPATDTAGARSDMETALRIDPTDDEAQAGLGLMLVNSGDKARAAELLARAATARPYDATLGLAASRAVFEGGDTAAALRLGATVAEAHPYDLVTCLGFAELQQRGGDMEGAYQTVLALAGRVPDLRVQLALASAAQQAGHTRQAADLYDSLAARTGRVELSALARRLRAGLVVPASPQP